MASFSELQLRHCRWDWFGASRWCPDSLDYFWFSSGSVQPLWDYWYPDPNLQRGEDSSLMKKRNRFGWLERSSAEAFLAIPNLYDPQYRDLVRHINPSPADNKTLLRIRIMSFIPMLKATGDCLTRPGDRSADGNDPLQRGTPPGDWSQRGLKLTQETRAMASVTYQNLFKMFPEVGRHDRDWEGRWGRVSWYLCYVSDQDPNQSQEDPRRFAGWNLSDLAGENRGFSGLCEEGPWKG